MKKCLRCGYEWESKKEHPKACPNCMSRKWDIARSAK